MKKSAEEYYRILSTENTALITAERNLRSDDKLHTVLKNPGYQAILRQHANDASEEDREDALVDRKAESLIATKALEEYIRKTTLPNRTLPSGYIPRELYHLANRVPASTGPSVSGTVVGIPFEGVFSYDYTYPFDGASPDRKPFCSIFRSESAGLPFRSQEPVTFDKDNEREIIAACERYALDKGIIVSFGKFNETILREADEICKDPFGLKSIQEARLQVRTEAAWRSLGLSVRRYLVHLHPNILSDRKFLPGTPPRTYRPRTPPQPRVTAITMGGAKPAPRSKTGANGRRVEFYDLYDPANPVVSEAVSGTEHKELDLGMTNNQLFYYYFHGRITPTRLPPPQTQLEDADVHALMLEVHINKRFPVSWLQETWSGVFNTSGLPLPHRRPMGRPAVGWDAETQEWRYWSVYGTYTLCGGGHLLQYFQDENKEHELDATTKDGGSWPWARPNRGKVRSYAQAMKDKVLFVLDTETVVRFDCVEHPERVDWPRMSAACISHIRGNGLVVPQALTTVRNGLKELPRPTIDVKNLHKWAEKRRTASLPNMDATEDTLSEYDCLLTAAPMQGYQAPRAGLVPRIPIPALPQVPPPIDQAPTSGSRDQSQQQKSRMPGLSSESEDEETALGAEDQPLAPVSVPEMDRAWYILTSSLQTTTTLAQIGYQSAFNAAVEQFNEAETLEVQADAIIAQGNALKEAALQKKGKAQTGMAAALATVRLAEDSVSELTINAGLRDDQLPSPWKPTPVSGKALQAMVGLPEPIDNRAGWRELRRRAKAQVPTLETMRRMLPPEYLANGVTAERDDELTASGLEMAAVVGMKGDDPQTPTQSQHQTSSPMTDRTPSGPSQRPFKGSFTPVPASPVTAQTPSSTPSTRPGQQPTQAAQRTFPGMPQTPTAVPEGPNRTTRSSAIKRSADRTVQLQDTPKKRKAAPAKPPV